MFYYTYIILDKNVYLRGVRKAKMYFLNIEEIKFSTKSGQWCKIINYN